MSTQPDPMRTLRNNLAHLVNVQHTNDTHIRGTLLAALADGADEERIHRMARDFDSFIRSAIWVA